MSAVLNGFTHVFIEGKTSPTTLLLLHGTGGDENDLVPVGRALAPGAALLSPRGKVLERGAPRFFRRLAEGVFDEEDLRLRARELAAFVREAAAHYVFDASKVFALGYSNGANIAAAEMLLDPQLLAGGVLLRAMVPLVPDPLPDLTGKHALIQAGAQDPIVPAENSERLAKLLSQAGAEVEVHWQNAGHNLGPDDFQTGKNWLQRFLK